MSCRGGLLDAARKGGMQELGTLTGEDKRHRALRRAAFAPRTLAASEGGWGMGIEELRD